MGGLELPTIVTTGLHENGMGGRLRTTDAALAFPRAGEWLLGMAWRIVLACSSGYCPLACFTSALDTGVLAKMQTHTDTRGRPHREHGEESIAWYRDSERTLRRTLHTTPRCQTTFRQLRRCVHSGQLG